MTHSPLDALDALRIIARAFEQLGVRYYVGGSIASSAHGLPRSTLDADVLAAIKSEHAEPFARLLGEEFYCDAPAAAESIRRLRSFNLIYLPKMFKVDIFPPAGLFDIRCLERAVIKPILEADPESRLPLASAEDIILHKLLWFRMGGGASERQWLDVINVLKVQAGRLDEDYLDRWANDLDLVPLLCEARKDAQR